MQAGAALSGAGLMFTGGYMKKTVALIMALLVFAILVCACENAPEDIIEDNISEIPEVVEGPVLFKSSEYAQNGLMSDKMSAIVGLCEKYMSEESFYYRETPEYDKASQTRYYSYTNKLFDDYGGGERLSYDEFISFLPTVQQTLVSGRKAYAIYDWETLDREVYDEWTTNEFVPGDPSYTRLADVNNDGIDDVVIGGDDLGSMYHQSTEIFILDKNGNCALRQDINHVTISKAVYYEGTYYLIRTLFAPEDNAAIGFDIFYIYGEQIEAVRVSSMETRPLLMDFEITDY